MDKEKKAKTRKRTPTTKTAAAGGRARALVLGGAERSAIAQKAAEARWKVPRATHGGVLEIGALQIPCFVLETGERVLSNAGMVRALGMARGSGFRGIGDRLARFAALDGIKPFASEALATATSNPLKFRTKTNVPAMGYPATILADICEAVLAARRAGSLHHKQVHIADRCEILARGFMRVGIIALVDEATGYQADRARDELNKILEAYIAEELRGWVKLFPDEFFRQIYRLRKWKYEEGNTKSPRYVGKLITRYIYDQLPPGVPEELRRLNPVVNGQRKHKHHQLLTEHTGVPHLDKQIAVVTTLMRVSDDRHEFEGNFQRAFPHAGEQLLIRYPRERDEEE